MKTLKPRTYPETSKVAAESCCEPEQGTLEKRILEVFVFERNAAQARNRLSPKGLSLKRALAAFASAGIGLQHTHSRSRLARARFRDNGNIRGFGIGSRLIVSTISLFLLPWSFASPMETLPSGSEGHYDFKEWAGNLVRVWHYVPEGVKADTPILFVMHGVRRDGDRYLRQWVPHAKKYDFILVVPEFSNEHFPETAGYNFGNTITPQGDPVPRERWAFSALEPIFDDVKARTGNQSETYNIFGHSAGSQFVHRFLYFVPDARVEHAISANAGWYTMPERGNDFPYGLKGTVVTVEQLRKNLARPLVILLGTQDTDPNHRSLRRTPEAMAQGRHRFERGHTFYEFAKKQAAALKVDFGWSIELVEGVAHSNEGMSGPAAALLYKGSK